MQTKGEEPDVLCDTSVAVPLVVVDHDHHSETAECVRGKRLGLCGHASFETFSVLTRLPPPLRRPPAMVRAVLHSTFPCSRYLSPAAASELIGQLAGKGVAGGAVYDALVAAAAVEHGVRLLTRDARAAETYRNLGAHFELLR